MDNWPFCGMINDIMLVPLLQKDTFNHSPLITCLVIVNNWTWKSFYIDSLLVSRKRFKETISLILNMLNLCQKFLIHVNFHALKLELGGPKIMDYLRERERERVIPSCIVQTLNKLLYSPKFYIHIWGWCSCLKPAGLCHFKLFGIRNFVSLCLNRKTLHNMVQGRCAIFTKFTVDEVLQIYNKP